MSIFCQREDLLVNFVQLVYVVTQATLFPDPASSQPKHAGVDRFLVALIKTMALLANNIYPTMPLETHILFSAGLTFASHVRPEDWHIWHGRSPEFVDGLMKLIHSLRSCEESQTFQFRLCVQHNNRVPLWNLRVSEVTYTSPNQELDASVISPDSDSLSGTVVTSPTSISFEKE